MTGTVLQAHDFAFVELDEVGAPNAATAWLAGRRVDLEFTAEVHGLPAAILAVEEEAQRRGGVLFLNPGSAGPRRFRLPVTIARIRVSGVVLEPHDMHRSYVAAD